MKMNKQNKKVTKYIDELNKKYCWSNTKNLDKFYSLNKKTYQQTKYIYKDVEPSFILQFGIILPIDIPFTKNNFSTFLKLDDGNKLGFTFHFDTLKEKSYFYMGKFPKFRRSFNSFRTRCEISILMKSTNFTVDEKNYDIKNDMETVKLFKLKQFKDVQSFSEAAKRVFFMQQLLQKCAIQDLNDVLLNYAFLSKDDTICSINSDNIEFASHFRGIDIANWKTYNWMIFHNIQAYPREQNSNFNDNYLAQSLLTLYSDDNFHEFKRHLQDSKYMLSRGHSVESLIELNTSIEVLISQILDLYWSNEEKLCIDEIKQRLEDISFIRRIKVELPKILGANWDITKKDTPLYGWYNNSYGLRNRMVHRGYIPEMKEVFDSINFSYDFINYIIGLMNKSKYNYLQGLNSVYKIDIQTIDLKKFDSF